MAAERAKLVINKILPVLVLGLIAGRAMAENPMQAMFPGKAGCYARSYNASHLAKHPEQLVTNLAIVADASMADPMLGLWIGADLRGDIAGHYEGYAYCETAGGSLSCGMEGDAGSFTVSSDKDGNILIEVGRYGMSFEGAVDFITLKADRGDDRSFILNPAPCG